MRTHALTLLCLTLFLTACANERIVEKPVIHEVVRTEYRDVPSDLVRKCEKTEIPETMTYGEALEGWAADRAQIDVCNGRLAGIESLGDDDGRGPNR